MASLIMRNLDNKVTWRQFGTLDAMQRAYDKQISIAAYVWHFPKRDNQLKAARLYRQPTKHEGSRYKFIGTIELWKNEQEQQP